MILNISHDRRAVRKHRVFIEVRVELLQPASQRGRFCGVHLTMNLNTDVHAWPNGLPNCTNPSYCVLFHFGVGLVQPVLRLECAEPNGSETLIRRGNSTGCKIINGIATNVHVAAHTIPRLTAHQFVNRNAKSLALDIPQGNIHG